MKKRIIIFAVLFLLLTAVCGLSAAYAAVPHLINYQGRLTNRSGTPLSGSYTLIFSIYEVENAGTPLWQGTYNNVAIVKGIFNVLLGDINDSSYKFENLAFDKPYWLQVKVGDDVMSPRQRITSSGYAIRAEKAEETEKLTGVLPVTNGGTGRLSTLSAAQAVGNTDISIKSDSLTDMNNMSVNITTKGTKLLVMFHSSVQMQGNEGGCYADIAIEIDGSIKTNQRGGTDSGTTAFSYQPTIGWGGLPFKLQWLETGLTPGNHTVKIKWRGRQGSVGGSVLQKGTVSPRVLTVIDLD